MKGIDIEQIISDYSQQLKQFFNESPRYAAILPMALGVLLIVGAVRNWDWVLEGDGRVFNLAWLSNVKGRTYARTVCGIFGGVLIVIGIFWFVIYSL